jgi:cell division protein FtsQ
VETTRANRRWRLVRARPEAVPTSLRRVYRSVPRPRSSKPWAYSALALAVVLAVAWVVLGTSLLGVRAVAVSGTRIATADQVRAAAAIEPGTPLARVDTDAVAERVGQLPPVGSVVVSRGWPHTIVITVTERAPLATVAVADGYGILDAEGVLFQVARRRPADLPLVRVDHPGPSDPATRAVLTVVRALTPELRDRLDSVVADAPSRIEVRLRGDRVIVWGDAEQNETKALVATSLLGRPGTTIDVSAPDVVTVS